MSAISKFASVFSALCALSVPAMAADQPLPRKAPPIIADTLTNWTGFYYGTHVGIGASNNAWNSADGILGVGVTQPFGGYGVSGGQIYGGQVGYNYQSGAWVVGAEGDFSFGQINGLARCGNAVFFCTTKIDNLGTLTARLGYATGNFLFYGKAGGAWADVDRKMTSGNFSNVFDGSETRAGWVVGAGAEYAFNNGMSAKIEYNYIDFGSKSLAMTDQGGNLSNVTVAQSAHLVKLGLNYKLGTLPFVGTVTPVAGLAVPQWSWTGFYVGAHAGGAFGLNEWKSATGILLTASSNGGFPGTGNAEGLFGGGQIGFNYQFGNWVTGLEIAASASDIDSYAKCATSVGGGVSFTCNNNISSIGTIAGRLGQTWGNLLIYTKAGAAWATGTSEARRFNVANVFNESSTRWGWMAGTGLEYAFSPNLSAFIEYDHLDFGTQNTNYVDQFGQTSVVGFKQKLDLVKVGVNYRLGWGAPILNANAADPVFLKAPRLPEGWTIEVGTRYFGSSGRMQKDLYDPTSTQRLNSRLIYADQTGHALESYFRFDHRNGLFVKGNFGLGHLVDGSLNDEDFPGFQRYSSTLSDMKNGRMMYGSADIGYNVINTPVSKLGAYVGYRSLYERANGYGCRQIATDGVCNPAFPTTLLGLSETESWRGVALGLNTQVKLSDRVKLEVDAAYLPYVNRAGFDNHWFRADINPQSEPGHGWGTQFEAILSYAVTDRFSVGVGGRYWFFATDEAHTQFPGSPTNSPMKFYSERYGGFLQASYKFGDVDTPEAKARAMYAKAALSPVAATNWTGFYVGGNIGSGWGKTRYADPFPTPATGDFVDIGGALAGGQVGYNYQTGQYVLGLEAAANWANIQGTNTCFGAFPIAAGAGFNCGSKIDAIGSLTARAGYAFDRAVIYAKGGAAWDRQRNEFNTNGFIGGAILSNTETKWGWTIGGGLEYALASNWSMAVEYKYYDFGKSDAFTTTIPGALAGVSLAPNSNRAQTVTLGVNYKITPGFVVAKY